MHDNFNSKQKLYLFIFYLCIESLNFIAIIVCMNNDLNIFIDKVVCVSPKQTVVVFKNQKLQQQFILMAIKGIHNKIMLIDELNNMFEFATILYSIHGKKIYLSSFEVNENYQQNGFGRLLFEIAIAHGDILDATEIYGEASPINNIKGVSDAENSTFEDEEKAIFTIYEKLGCKINPLNHNFYNKWTSGKKFNKPLRLLKKLHICLPKKTVFQEKQHQPE